MKTYNDYFEHIASANVDIRHTPQTPAFFKYDWLEFMAAKRKQPTVLFMHSYQGHLTGNVDNPRDVSRIQWSVLQRIAGNQKNGANKVIAATEEIAREIIAKMHYDRDENPNREWCKLLEFFNLDEVEYRIDDIYEDEWTGYRVITPLAKNINLEINPSKWL